jgi:hypothetical protein
MSMALGIVRREVVTRDAQLRFCGANERQRRPSAMAAQSVAAEKTRGKGEGQVCGDTMVSWDTMFILGWGWATWLSVRAPRRDADRGEASSTRR